MSIVEHSVPTTVRYPIGRLAEKSTLLKRFQDAVTHGKSIDVIIPVDDGHNQQSAAGPCRVDANVTVTATGVEGEYEFSGPRANAGWTVKGRYNFLADEGELEMTCY